MSSIAFLPEELSYQITMASDLSIGRKIIKFPVNQAKSLLEEMRVNSASPIVKDQIDSILVMFNFAEKVGGELKQIKRDGNLLKSTFEFKDFSNLLKFRESLDSEILNRS